MAYCPHCGESTIGGQRFCMKCGTTLSHGPVVPRQTPAKSNTGIIVAVLASVFVPLLVGVVVVPNLLRVRMTPREGGGAAGVRTLVVAEVTYQASYGRFASDIKALDGSAYDCSRPTSANACLIDTAIADSSPSRPKSGYYYLVRVGPNPYTFVVAGIPLNRLSKGYCAVEDGVVHVDAAAFGSGSPSYEACKRLPPLS